MNPQSLATTGAFALSVVGAYIFVLADTDGQRIGPTSKAWLSTYAATSSDKTKVRQRIARLNPPKTYEEFRVEQFTYSIAIAISLFLASTLLLGKFLIALLLSCTAGALTYYAIDRELSRRLDRQRRQLEEEFPAVIELMSLSLSAGETPAQAIFRIGERAQGYLAREFTIVVEQMRHGVPFQIALDEFGRRVESVIIRRFVDSLVTAVVRGAPLVDVLQRQAQESRQIHKNAVLEKAGKAEISMMIPIVFLILPISILFALWPSLSTMNLFV